MIKNLQKTFISTYRIVMMAVLAIIVTGVLSYLFLIIFYTLDENWGVPIILSPSQERVLAFQAQAATLEATLLKNKVDLDTAVSKYKLLSGQIVDLESLIAKFSTAQHDESSQLSKIQTNIHGVLQQKRMDTRDMEKAAHDAKPLLASVDRELAAGLITKDEAISRRMAIQSMLNAATDSRISQIALQQQEWEALSGSRTLGGNTATSLTALQSLTSQAQLKVLQAQASVDAETARQSIVQLRATIAEGERVLETVKRSPYYRALTEPVYVAFAQYQNLPSAEPGAPVYDCLLQVIICFRVGTITQVYDAEEYTHHPIFKTDIKGKFVGIDFSRKKSGQSSVVFFGHRPLLF